MLFALTMWEQFCVSAFILVLGVCWLASKAAQSPTVQKGAVEGLFNLFKK